MANSLEESGIFVKTFFTEEIPDADALKTKIDEADKRFDSIRDEYDQCVLHGKPAEKQRAMMYSARDEVNRLYDMQDGLYAIRRAYRIYGKNPPLIRVRMSAEEKAYVDANKDKFFVHPKESDAGEEEEETDEI